MTYNINEIFYTTGFKISILLVLITAGICLGLGLLLAYVNKAQNRSNVNSKLIEGGNQKI